MRVICMTVNSINFNLCPWKRRNIDVIITILLWIYVVYDDFLDTRVGQSTSIFTNGNTHNYHTNLMLSRNITITGWKREPHNFLVTISYI